MFTRSHCTGNACPSTSRISSRPAILAVLTVTASACPLAAALEAGPSGEFPRTAEPTARASSTDPSVLLKSLIYALLEILDVSDTQSEAASELWLDSDANLLINGYASDGIDPTISSQETAAALDDCDEALTILLTEAENLAMSAARQVSLKQTIETMQSELVNDD